MKKITLLTISLLTLASFQTVKADDLTTAQPTEPQTEQTTPETPVIETPTEPETPVIETTTPTPTEPTTPEPEQPAQESEFLGAVYYIGEGMESIFYDDTLNLDSNTSYTIMVKARYTLDVPQGTMLTLNYNGIQSVPVNSNGTAYITFTTGSNASNSVAYIGLSDDNMLPFTINVKAPTPEPTPEPTPTPEPEQPSENWHNHETPVTTPEQPTQETPVIEEETPVQETTPTPEPTQTSEETPVQETADFVTDTLPQTGSKDTLGNVLQIVGLALYAVLVAVIAYMVAKRRNKNVK